MSGQGPPTVLPGKPLPHPLLSGRGRRPCAVGKSSAPGLPAPCPGLPCLPHPPARPLPHGLPPLLHSLSALRPSDWAPTRPLPTGQQLEKQQTPNKRPWESLRKAHGPPAWVKGWSRSHPSPLELRRRGVGESGATIPLVGQDIIDLPDRV